MSQNDPNSGQYGEYCVGGLNDQVFSVMKTKSTPKRFELAHNSLNGLQVEWSLSHLLCTSERKRSEPYHLVRIRTVGGSWCYYWRFVYQRCGYEPRRKKAAFITKLQGAVPVSKKVTMMTSTVPSKKGHEAIHSKNSLTLHVVTTVTTKVKTGENNRTLGEDWVRHAFLFLLVPLTNRTVWHWGVSVEKGSFWVFNNKNTRYSGIGYSMQRCTTVVLPKASFGRLGASTLILFKTPIKLPK